MSRFFAHIISSCRLLAVVAIAGYLGSAATPAEAQHADIQVQQNTEATLMTGQVDLDTYPATLVFPRRVFQRGFGDNFISNNPGFNAGAGTGSLPPGILDLPAMANLGFNMPAFYLPQHGPSNLAFWDGFGEVDFAPSPAGHTLTVDGPVPNPDPTTIGVVDGAATNVPGYAFDRTDANGALHRHQTFSLEASGSPAEGIYLWAMELTMEGLTASAPVYIFHETPGIQAPVEAMDDAVAWAAANLELLDTIPGDLNNDRAVNGLDVDPFVTAVLGGPFDPAADMNFDGTANGLDVDPFVAAVLGGGMRSVPEPSAMVLAAAAGLAMATWAQRRSGASSRARGATRTP